MRGRRFLILCELLGVAILFAITVVLGSAMMIVAYFFSKDYSIVLKFNMFNEARAEGVIAAMFIPLACYTLIRVFRRGLREARE